MPLPLDPPPTITVSAFPQPSLITVAVPGQQGPPGVFNIGTVTTGAPGSSASATQTTDVDGIPVIDLVIPRGDVGPTGPANALVIGTVTTGSTGTPASATITGTAPNQILNLVLPKGDQGPTGATGSQGIQGIQGPQGIPGTNGRDGAGVQIAGQVASYSALPTTLTSADAGKAYLNTADGKLYVWTGSAFPANGSGSQFTGPTGPANTLTIGTVTNGSAGGAANATITGTAPNQVLNLTLPTGATGPANTLVIGTVTTGATGSNAAATITGSAPNQTLNLTIPTGATGPAGPTGPQGPTGAGVLVLGATDPVPSGTPTNTVIYRPAVKTATYYWGSGTAYPSTGVGAGDTFFHTGLNAMMRYNGSAWRHSGPVVCADAPSRNTISTNYASVLYAGFQVRQTDTAETWEWDGAKWCWLYKDTMGPFPGFVSVGAAGAPAFANSWVNYNPAAFMPARYTKTPSGMVIVQGLITNGTFNVTGGAFTLPPGFRPSNVLIFTTSTNPNTAGRCDVTPDGTVLPVAGSNVYFGLNGITFPAEL